MIQYSKQREYRVVHDGQDAGLELSDNWDVASSDAKLALRARNFDRSDRLDLNKHASITCIPHGRHKRVRVYLALVDGLRRGDQVDRQNLGLRESALRDN